MKNYIIIGLLRVSYSKYSICDIYKYTCCKKYSNIIRYSLSTAASEKPKIKKSTKYKDTILFPSTPFAANLQGKKRIDNEEEIRKLSDFQSKYVEQESRQSREFILHDGPPYANGNLHMGHALNKILKDVTVRYKYLKGYKVNFIPGWDCHGLPIELEALKDAQKKRQTKGNWENFSTLDIRSKAKTVAEAHIKSQKAIFEQWGIFADWKNPYLTMNPSYVAKELKLFKELYDKGYIFQAYMPVHFSPSSRTSLAESELEYNKEHVSPSLYLALALTPEGSEKILKNWTNAPPVYICIWTTTPWTLPANMAVSISEELEYYVLLTHVEGKEIILIWACDRVEDLSNLLNIPYNILFKFKGKHLKGLSYFHPVYTNLCQIIAGTHVSAKKGTGLVHTAPAHGKKDFLVAIENGIPSEIQLIDENGRYKKEAGDALYGKSVLKEGNDAVINIIKNRRMNRQPFSPFILNLGSVTHSYPYDWRTKKPTIIRASKQWFFDISKVRNAVLEALENVSIHPENLRESFLSLIDSRPYWCLSRQRVWGVPIPVFYEAKSGKPVVESKIIEHISTLMEKEGTEIWWKYSEDKLLPPDYIKSLQLKGEDLPVKGTDILDIWFDSGSSWYCTMNGKKSDVYLEGNDQLRGWFQSSLLTSVACTGEAPYKSLVLHGFTVDEDNKKMSKSLKNVIDPFLITNGGKNLNISPAFGVNVLRWWTLKSTFIKDVSFGMQLVQACEYEVQALRNAFKFLLGNLKNFHPKSMLNLDELRLHDKYILSTLQPYLNQVWNLYEELSYEKVAEVVYQFIVNEIGNTYLNTTKDIMFFEEENNVKRKSVQTVVYLILPYLLSSLEPLLPHLTEEVKLFYNKFNDKCSTRVNGINVPEEWNSFSNKETEEILRINECFLDKVVTMGGIRNDHKGKYKVHINAGKELQQSLMAFQSTRTENYSDLCSILEVSEVTLDFDSSLENFILEVSEANKSYCLRCRKHVYCEDEICKRCEGVIAK